MTGEDSDDEADLSNASDGVDLSDPEFYLNRELSELAFQERVLNEALDERNPLLERVRFLAIFTRNMDEFFMKRVGGLKQQIDAGVTDRTVDGRTPREQWEEVLERARPLFDRQTECYEETVRGLLSAAGIDVLAPDELTDSEHAELREYFERSVLPTLTPLTFDPAHPFPFISNLSLSLAVLTREDGEDGQTFTRVKVPQNLPRLVAVEEGSRYVLIEEVIRSNLDLLFPNVEVVETALFRLTRNAEVRRDEEVAEDLIDMIEEVLEQRRFATAVRLELEAGTSERVRETLVDQLDLDDREVFERSGPMDFREFERFLDLDRPELKRDSWTPQPHPKLQRSSAAFDGSSDEGSDVFSQIREGDVLLHHPYHSFTDTVQRFLDEAARDPDVLAIKAAIYRTASDSQVIQRLIEAADNGKQVAVMVELKARFDEQNNLEWVRKLEENGIHVAYGTVGLKTHTKTALVVREEEDGVRLYSHVATGNYHSETAKGYVDLGLLTADRDIGQDLVKVFNFFTGPSLDEQFRELLIAPVTMRERFTEYVRREAERARDGERARIVVKVNGLEDPEMVAELYRAGMAGVDVDLIVRDICRLRPGIEGVSDSIDVYSHVGRFLEHSRIFYFENGGDPEYFVGSADWMTRNLDYRVEAVAPVTDIDLRRQLRFVLELMLRDNRNCWEMRSDGTYEQRRAGPDEEIVDTHEVLMEQVRRAKSDGGDRGIPAGYPIDTDLLVAPVEGSGSDEAAEAGADESAEAGPDESAESGPDDPGSTDGDDDPPVADGRSGDHEQTDARPESAAETDDYEAILEEFADAWYRPESDRYDYAVRTPDGDRQYRKTASGAASVVHRFYVDGEAASD
mgnify:FL=1